MELSKIIGWICVILIFIIVATFITNDVIENTPKDPQATKDCLNNKVAEYCALNGCEIREKIVLGGFGYTYAIVFDYKTYEERKISLPLQDYRDCGVKVD